MKKFLKFLILVLIPELNPGSANIRHNYYVTLMIIKILKYFCEEHNQKFQRIFFMKEDDGISMHYDLHRNLQVTEDNNIIFFDLKNEQITSVIKNEHPQFINILKHYLHI